MAEAIRAVSGEGQTAAGIYSTDATRFELYNSRGVSASYRETMARFSITAMAGDSSGWAKASACDLRGLDPVALARSAARKAAGSRDPRELPAGRYTVILEPAAVLDLVGQMFADFSGTAIRDGRSFLNDRIGKKLFGENITVYDDAAHPLQSGAAFDAEGVPRRRLTLVEDGVVREIAYCRQAAALAGVAPTGHGFPLPNDTGEAPMNIVIAGGDTSVEEMVAATERGILVTRLWYIREVDPYEKIFTGMTRDGTFLVEGGQVTCGSAQFSIQRGTDGDAVECRSAIAGGASVGRGDVRYGGAGDEGARLQLHGSDAVLVGWARWPSPTLPKTSSCEPDGRQASWPNLRQLVQDEHRDLRQVRQSRRRLSETRRRRSRWLSQVVSHPVFAGYDARVTPQLPRRCPRPTACAVRAGEWRSTVRYSSANSGRPSRSG